MEYEIRTEGLNDFTLRFRAIRELREDILETLEEAAQAAGSYMGTHVPYHSGQLYRAINVGPVAYSPGASGGGGFYEIHVGVDESQAPHAEWVIGGTGIFNRDHPTNGIFPAKGNVMVFEAHGQKVFTAWTRGQEPRREWFEQAQDLAQSIIARKIAGI